MLSRWNKIKLYRLSLEDLEKELNQLVGTTPCNARFVESYFNMGGYDGYYAEYLKGEATGTVKEVINTLLNDWIPNQTIFKTKLSEEEKQSINYQLEKGLFKKTIRVWLLTGATILLGTYNYFIDISPE